MNILTLFLCCELKKKDQGLLPGLFFVKVIQCAVQRFAECVCGGDSAIASALNIFDSSTGYFTEVCKGLNGQTRFLTQLLQSKHFHHL